MRCHEFRDIRVSAVQFSPLWLDPVQNAKNMAEAIRRIADEGEKTELIVFPELSSAGYILKERDREFGREYYGAAEPIPGPTTLALARQAKESGAYVVVGVSEKHPSIPGMLYNSAVLLSPSGDIVGVHRKIHIPGYERFYFCPGHEINVYRTNIGTLGLSICYDNQFPELTRIMALKGMEVLCMLWNMPDFSNVPDHLRAITAARALENRLFAISCNRPEQADKDITFIGASCIADPVGTILCQAERAPVTISARLSAKQFVEDRFFQPVFRDRRPELYGALTEPV